MSADPKQIAAVNGEREVIEGEGIVVFYNPRRFDPETKQFGGFGFIHRTDKGCEGDPRTCRDEEHRIHFTVFQAQYVGAQNLAGARVRFIANSSRREGNSPSAFRLERVEQKKERPEKMIPADVAHEK